MNYKLFFSLLSVLLFSLPAFAQWQQITALPQTPIYDLFTEGDTIYAAAKDRLFYSFDGGENWGTTAIIHTKDDEVVDILLAKGTIYVGTVLDGVYRSQNGGQSWQQFNTGLNGVGAQNIYMLAQRGDSIYAATSGAGVYVKPLIPVNASWSPYNLGMPWGNVWSIVNDEGTLLAGAGGNGTLARNSWDNSQWEEIEFASFNGQLNPFYGAIRDGEVLLGAGALGLYRSTDDGFNWDFYNPGFGLLDQVRFARKGDKILAYLSKISKSFLLVSEDQGLSWSPFSPALPNPTTRGYDVAVCHDRVFVARINGLWRLSPTVDTEDPAEATASVGQNIPNPVNDGNTMIPLTLQKAAHVQLALYDLQGKQLKSLEKGDLPAGTHQLQLDVQDLAAGSYMYCVSLDGRTVSRILQISE